MSMRKVLLVVGVVLIVACVVAKAHDSDYSDESVENTTVDVQWIVTINQTCTSSKDCEQMQECVVVGNVTDPDARVCRCKDRHEYNDVYQYCFAKYSCYDYCDFERGFACIMDECVWLYPDIYPEIADNYPESNNYESIPMYVIVGFFSVCLFIMLLVWKCTVQRRLNLMLEASRATAAQRTNASLFSSDEATAAQDPPQRDDPPKYSTLIAPWTTPDVRIVNECQRPPTTSPPDASAPPLATLSLNVSEAERLAFSAPIDAPPPYSEVLSSNQRAPSN